jgi:hypothetical protein
MSERIEVIAELKDLISGKFKEINAQIDAMDSKLAGMNGGGGGRGGLLGAVVGGNLLAGAISKATGAAIEFGKESFYAFGHAEQFQASLTTMLHGNSQLAGALNNTLKDFAIESPFELTEIQEGTKMMIAYGSSAGNVVDEMRMLGDIGSGVGSSLSELAYLYGTLRTQGRAFSKDIYQFTGRGIPIVKELAKQFKVAESAVMGLVEQGKVGFPEVEKAMKSMTAEGGQFHDMMKVQAQTLLGQTSNLSDAWEQLKVSIGESQSGILKGTVAWATEMVNALRGVMDRNNYLDKATAPISDKYKIGKFGFDDDEKDTRPRAFRQGVYKDFGSEKERNEFLYGNGGQNKNEGWDEVAGKGSREILNDFVAKIQGGIKGLKPEDVQNKLNEITEMKRDILAQVKGGRMSNGLAINELAVLSQATKDTMGIRALGKTKDEQKKAAEPKKLEDVAKANKAVQMIVNIENLVREYTNEMITPDQAKQMTTGDISKALVAAVNDLYAVGM